MNEPNYPLMIFICVVFVLFVVLWRRFLKARVDDLEKAGKYDRKMASAAFLIYPVSGSIFIIIALSALISAPPGDGTQAVGASFIIFGLGMAAYGVYKWYHERNGG